MARAAACRASQQPRPRGPAGRAGAVHGQDLSQTGKGRGGYRLARPADAITVLDVVDAVEGRKPLFDCQEVRGRCAVFGGKPPAWSSDGVCGIHAVMLRAEKAMRDELACTTLGGLARSTARKAPGGFLGEIDDWLAARALARPQRQKG